MDPPESFWEAFYWASKGQGKIEELARVDYRGWVPDDVRFDRGRHIANFYAEQAHSLEAYRSRPYVNALFEFFETERNLCLKDQGFDPSSAAKIRLAGDQR